MAEMRSERDVGNEGRIEGKKKEGHKESDVPIIVLQPKATLFFFQS
jgi:hypothetical protein